MKNLAEVFESSDESTAAFYIPGSDSIFIIDGEEHNETNFTYYAIHEYTHALQEQYFNPFSGHVLPAKPLSYYNSDFFLAQLCVAEGDACLTMDKFILDIGDSSLNLLSIYTENVDTFYSTLKQNSIPRYRDIKMYTPYILGPAFIANIYMVNGWQAVNDLYHANRIQSTVDIITSKPVKLHQFDFSSVIPKILKNALNLRFADDDSYGPIMLMALTSEYIDVDHCKKAFGWRGDRIYYVLNENEKYGSFLWALAFEDSTDAQYMFTAFDSLLTHRYISGSLPVRIAAENLLTYSHAGIHTTIMQQDNLIFWAENLPEPNELISSINTTSLAKTGFVEGKNMTLTLNEKQMIMKKLFGGRPLSRSHMK
jgi:hypothetical protein